MLSDMICSTNPFNLRIGRSRWIGLKGGYKGFCVFDTTAHCVRAVAKMLMRTYRQMHVRTYSQIIQRYAPDTENNTEGYINFICDKMSAFPWDEPRNVYDFAALLHWISVFEVGLKDAVTYEYVLYVIQQERLVPYDVK